MESSIEQDRASAAPDRRRRPLRLRRACEKLGLRTKNRGIDFYDENDRFATTCLGESVTSLAKALFLRWAHPRRLPKSCATTEIFIDDSTSSMSPSGNG